MVYTANRYHKSKIVCAVCIYQTYVIINTLQNKFDNLCAHTLLNT
jgi:hypothetical protein